MFAACIKFKLEFLLWPNWPYCSRRKSLLLWTKKDRLYSKCDEYHYVVLNAHICYTVEKVIIRRKVRFKTRMDVRVLGLSGLCFGTCSVLIIH